MLVLQELNYKICKLKQTYFGQMDRKKSWEQVDQIIKILNTGTTFLDFPADEIISKYVVE